MRVGSVVLLHSPLVTAATWGGFPAELRERGLAVHLVDVTADLEPPYASRYVASVAQQLLVAQPTPPLVLVGHSGAGPLLPAVGRAQRAAGRSVGGYVFLDAGLPRAGATRLDLLADEDPEMAATLQADLAAGAEFPAWTGGDLEQELPDAAARSAVLESLRPRRLGFFTEPLLADSVAGADDWPDAPCAYLRTSEAYEHWAHVAGMRGWEVETLQPDALVGHFAALRDPAGLATTLAHLIAAG